ncbi:MAG: hypothetical protein ACHBN1_23695 [Heteroscytonema crispum UTEX LB 1556]
MKEAAVSCRCLGIKTQIADRTPPCDRLEEEIEIPEAVPLSPQDEVIVKDVWNKLRAWKELQMEKFWRASIAGGTATGVYFWGSDRWHGRQLF